MTNNMYCNLPDLIEHTYDNSTRELLAICSIPSLFTKDLIEFYFSYTEKISLYNIEDEIKSFLSQPFLIKRKFKTKMGIVEAFAIHDSLKKIILSSSSNVVQYAYILIDYYNCASDYGISKLKNLYLSDKGSCEMITGNICGWRKCIQAAIENNLVEECNKLILTYRDSLVLLKEYKFFEVLWLEYYKLVCGYLENTSYDTLKFKISSLLNSILQKDFAASELKVFLYDLLGMVQLNNNCLEQAFNSFKNALNLCLQSNINNANITGTIYLNIIAVCIKLSNLNQVKQYVKQIQLDINKYDEELKINAYKILGLYKRHIFNFNEALNDYYVAKNLLLKKQKSLKNYQNSNREIEIKPIYYVDEHSIYDSIGEIFVHQGKHQKAINIYRHALKSQILSQNYSGIAWSKYNIGRIEYLLGNIDSSFSFFNQSLYEFRKINQEYNCAYIYGEQSYVYQYLGITRNSINSLEKSIDIFLEYNMYPQAILYFNHLGRLYQSQGFLEISDKILNVCMNYLGKPGNSENIGWLYNNLARNYMYSEQYDMANFFFVKAKKAFEKSQNLRGLIYVINNIAELYVKLNRFSEAKALFKISLRYKKNMGDQHAICYTLRELGEFYLKKGNIVAAKSHLNESLEICEKYGFKMLLGEIYISFAKLYGLEHDEIKENAFYNKAANVYKSQNFISRLINCHNLQLGSLLYQKNINLYLIKKLEIQFVKIKYTKQNKKLQEQLEDIFKRIEKEIR